jgi:triacylglycerol lipase
MNIILAHGFFGFRQFLSVEYFNGVKSDLEAKFHDLPIKILVPQVNLLGRVEARGQQLIGLIARALSDGTLDPVQPIHIIAHSMGGLDARYCISSGFDEAIAHKISSLSTIGTPHWGSPIADLLIANSHIDHIKRPLIFSTGPLGALIREVDLVAGGIQDLTSASAEIFNQRHLNSSNVRYFSYAGGGRDTGRATCALLLATHALIRERTAEENDGLVSVKSATWGELLEVWPGDHADEVNHNLDQGVRAPSLAFDALKKYERIITMLASFQ